MWRPSPGGDPPTPAPPVDQVAGRGVVPCLHLLVHCNVGLGPGPTVLGSWGTQCSHSQTGALHPFRGRGSWRGRRPPCVLWRTVWLTAGRSGLGAWPQGYLSLPLGGETERAAPPAGGLPSPFPRLLLLKDVSGALAASSFFFSFPQALLSSWNGSLGGLGLGAICQAGAPGGSTRPEGPPHLRLPPGPGQPRDCALPMVALHPNAPCPTLAPALAGGRRSGQSLTSLAEQ